MCLSGLPKLFYENIKTKQKDWTIYNLLFSTVILQNKLAFAIIISGLKTEVFQKVLSDYQV